MAKALRSTPPEAQSPEFPSGRGGSQPRTRMASVLLSQRSRLGCGSSGLSNPAAIAASPRRSSLPASWLPGLLLLAVTSALLPGAFTAPLVSVAVAVAVVLALLLIDALGSSAVAGKLAAMIVALIGLPARHTLLATAWRASSGREHPLKQPTDR